MQTWCVMASGPSLNDEDVAYIKLVREQGRLAGVAAVSNVGLDKAPWADILVSYDSAWWREHPQAADHQGVKYANNRMNKVCAFQSSLHNGCNSGLFAMEIVRDIYKAERIILLGFDMHGTHYFGPHGERLKNTTTTRFKHHIRQFNGWSGPEVINCTIGSALTRFHFADLRVII